MGVRVFDVSCDAEVNKLWPTGSKELVVAAVKVHNATAIPDEPQRHLINMHKKL